MSSNHNISSSRSSHQGRTYHPSLKEQRHTHDEERRAHLIDTACKLIQKQGYNHTTMDDIAHHSGMSKKTVYLFFPSKQALIEKLIIERLFTPLMVEPSKNSDDLDAQLFNLIQQIAEQLLDKKRLGLMRAIIGETTRSTTIAQLMTEIFHLSGRKFSLQKWLVTQKEAGHLYFDCVYDTTDHLFGLTLGAPILSQLTHCSPARDKDQLNHFLKEGIRIFLNGCRSTS